MAYKDIKKQKEFHKKWYLKNRVRLIEKALKNNRLYKIRNRNFLREIKNSPCVDCGNKFHFSAMDYDHIGTDKKFNVGRMVGYSMSIEAMKNEIAKCELVCANCHRIRTFKRKQGI